jgi:hypothetical protein
VRRLHENKPLGQETTILDAMLHRLPFCRAIPSKAASAISRLRLGLCACLCVFLLSACACNLGSTQVAPVPAVPLMNAKNPLATPTYDGSGQSVEPDITYFTSRWHGFHYWMACSPYPNGNQRDENPSILASNDGMNWQVPPGLVNPLAQPSPGDMELADASIFYDSDSDQLWVYYIDVFPTSMNLKRLTSADGVTWHNDGVLFTAPNYQILSPTVSKIDKTYYMWVVNGGDVGCTTTSGTSVDLRSSVDGIHWSDPQPVSMNQPGHSVWHINVKWIPSEQEFWVAASAFAQSANCAGTVLFFQRSRDGVNWTSYSRVALDKGKGKVWDEDQIYRSTLWYDPSSDRLSIWYSARGGEPPSIPAQIGQWHVGLTQGDYRELVAWLSQ